MADSVNTILRRAYDELVEREDRFAAIIAEHKQTVAARKGLAKQLGITSTTPKAQRQITAGTGTGTLNVSSGVPAEIIAAVVGSLDPLTGADIADRIGRDWKPWMSAMLSKMVGAGQLIITNAADTDAPSKYGVPQKLAAPISSEDAAV